MKLNLGCGEHKPSGWVSVDIDPNKTPDVVADARCLPWEDNYFSQVMLCHVLEHFELYDVPKVLNETRRVLAPGGQLLVVCPDINSLMHHYMKFDGVNRMGRQEWTGRGTPEGFLDVDSIFRDIFGLIVLEDDFFEHDTKAGADYLPHSDHRWNTYGRRLLEKVNSVFPHSRLLGSATEDFLDQCEVEEGTRNVLWTDPETNLKWETVGWSDNTCAVLATKA